MPDLILGVVDVSYTDDVDPRDPTRARITKKGRVHVTDAQRIQRWMEGRSDDGPTTTAKVAQALEDKYQVMGHFYEALQDNIAGAVIHSLEGALEDLYAGAPVKDPYAEVGQEIAAAFRQFLLQGEIESMGVEGVPTKASIERKSSRFKSGTSPGPRPSFIDTSLYELSMRAWVE
jgi:hypothetical protein